MNTKLIFGLLLVSFIVGLAHAGVHPLNEDAVELGRVKREGHGSTGVVHTYVKTDKHANFKWGVRHHVGHHYAG